MQINKMGDTRFLLTQH